MRKLLLLAIVSLFMCSGLMAQEVNEKSVVIQNIDSMQLNRITHIENSLSSFHHANRKSQFFIFTGAALATLGTILYDPRQGQVNFLPVIGGAFSLIGGVIYLDSYKYLNFNKKKKQKQINSDWY